MTTPDQVYKIHIDATPDKVWTAITNPEFSRQYFFCSAFITPEWKKGAPIRLTNLDTQQVMHEGEILECDPPRLLVMSWHNPGDLTDVSRVRYEIAPARDGADLTIIHGDFIDNSAMAPRVAGGWPKIIENMKAYLEDGKISGPKVAGGSCAA